MLNISISELNNISTQINIYMSNTLFLFGIIGNLLNCWIFTQTILRTNPIAIYFLGASLSNLINIIFGMTPRMFNGFHMLFITDTISACCKIRLIVLFTTRTVTSWLLLFGTIDRYLTSSPNVNRRLLSNLRRTYQLIGFTFIICLIPWIELLYCVDINIPNSSLTCDMKSIICRVYNDIGIALIIIILPSSMMLIFGFLTISNIRRLRRLKPCTNNRSSAVGIRRRRTENSLICMLLSQVFLLTIFNLPEAILHFYITHTIYQSKPPSQLAFEGFILNIALLITFIPNCISFYLYILTGSVFRETFIQCVYNIIRRLKCFH